MESDTAAIRVIYWIGQQVIQIYQEGDEHQENGALPVLAKAAENDYCRDQYMEQEMQIGKAHSDVTFRKPGSPQLVACSRGRIISEIWIGATLVGMSLPPRDPAPVRMTRKCS